MNTPLVIRPRAEDVEGQPILRPLPSAKCRSVGPFVFFDHMLETRYPAGKGMNIRQHPHIGLSTLTYLFEGEILHHDNLGYDQAIRPGEVNWMTAGSGIVHSERTAPEIRAAGARMHGMQAWVALPTEFEEVDPSFHHHSAADMPTFEGDGLTARLIAGEAYGGSAKVKTHSPLFYVHWEMGPDVRTTPPKGHSERALYVARGSVEVGDRIIHAGQMAVLEKTAEPVVRATEDSTVMLLGGEPVGPRHIWWNFVSSSQDRIEQAKADWKAGRMTLPAGDDQEFIPLPENEPAKAAD